MSHQGQPPHILSPTEPGSLENPDSFIVIARSPNGETISQVPNGSIPAHTSYATQECSSVGGLSSAYTLHDLCPEEIENKVQALVEENTQLKEALRQNNLAMKKQFDTLVSWQQEVFKTHQNHKEKFDASNQIISKLKAENAKLHERVADLERSQQLSPDVVKLQAENAVLRTKLTEAETKEKVVCIKEFELKKEIAYLKGKMEDLQKQLSEFQVGHIPLQRPPPKQRSDADAAVKAEKEELGGNGGWSGMDKEKVPVNSFVMVNECLDVLPGKIESPQRMVEHEAARRQIEEHQKVLEVERQALEEDRKALEKNRKAMCEKLKESEEQRKKVEMERDTISMKLAEMAQVIHHERESARELQRMLEDRLKDSVPHQYGNWEILHSATAGDGSGGSHLRACESRLGLIREYLFSQEKKNIKIEVWMQKLHQIIVSLMAIDPSKGKELKEEVLNLKKQISDETNELEQQRGHLIDAERLLAELKQAFDTIQAKEASVSSVVKENGEADYYKAQVIGYQQKLDGVTARLAQTEETLHGAQAQSAGLLERLRTAETEMEAIPILKAQVEVYQTDFNTEREERERMAAEKQKLTEEVHRLRAQNQRLLDDMENMTRREMRDNPRLPPDGTASASGQMGGGATTSKGNVFNTLATPGRGNQRSYVNSVPDIREESQDRFMRGSSEPKIFTCPKCFQAFMELGPLEVHVNECLDTP